MLVSSRMRVSTFSHLEVPHPKTPPCMIFFENYISFISMDFILGSKDTPNESDTKIYLLKVSSVYNSKKSAMCRLLKNSFRAKLKEPLIVI